MNNEPVKPFGWFQEFKETGEYDFTLSNHSDTLWSDKQFAKDGNYIPLYTHPAKTLTDEEIYEIAMEVQTGFLPQDDTLAFARAILRKAQEK